MMVGRGLPSLNQQRRQFSKGSFVSADGGNELALPTTGSDARLTKASYLKPWNLRPTDKSARMNVALPMPTHRYADTLTPIGLIEKPDSF